MDTPRRPKWRCQFRIRTLLIIVTVCGLWFGAQVNRHAQQGDAVLRLTSVGGAIEYEDEIDPNEFEDAGFVRGSPTVRWARRLLALECLREVFYVRLENGPTTDETIDVLVNLPELQYLIIEDAHVTTSGMQKLQRLKRLHTLFLSGDALNDATVAPLSHMPTLTTLVISSSNVTSAAIDELRAALPQAFVDWYTW